MQGAEGGEKATLKHSPESPSRAEGLEGPQEAGGETAQVRKTRVRKKNISLRLEQAGFTGVNGFEVYSVILAKSGSLMVLFPSPSGKACAQSHLLNQKVAFSLWCVLSALLKSGNFVETFTVYT